MALLPACTHHNMQLVFNMHEEGKLKGGKKSKMSQTNIRKALDGQFSSKLYHFKPFQCLQVSRVKIVIRIVLATQSYVVIAECF